MNMSEKESRYTQDIGRFVRQLRLAGTVETPFGLVNINDNTNLYTIIGVGHTETKAQYFHESVNRFFRLNQCHFSPYEIHDFERGFEEIRQSGMRGVTVTLPHKELAWSYIAKFGIFGNEQAKVSGAINTIIFNNRDVIGWNTDIVGFGKSLKKAEITIEGEVCTIIGCGGMGRAALQVLSQVKAREIRLFDINSEKARHLQGDFYKLNPFIPIVVTDSPREACNQSKVIIQCSPIGMRSKMNPFNEYTSPISKNLLNASHIVVDSVYVPMATRLITEAKEKGCKVVSGLEFVIHGGIEQIQLYLGSRLTDLDVETAYKIGKAALLAVLQ